MPAHQLALAPQVDNTITCKQFVSLCSPGPYWWMQGLCWISSCEYKTLQSHWWTIIVYNLTTRAILKAETFKISNAHWIERWKHVKLPVLSGTCNSASSASKIMRERAGTVNRASQWTRNLRLYAVSLRQALFGYRCLWDMILHALRALDSCSFHLCCLWLLYLETFTYELETTRVPGEAFEAVAGDREGGLRGLGLWHQRERGI